METFKSPLNPQGTNDEATDKATIAAANETLSWLEPLCADVNFQRFMGAVFAKAVLREHKRALNVLDLSKDERDTAAQRHDALNEVFQWPEINLKAARKAIAKQQEKRDPEQQTAKFPGSPL